MVLCVTDAARTHSRKHMGQIQHGGPGSTEAERMTIRQPSPHGHGLLHHDGWVGNVVSAYGPAVCCVAVLYFKLFYYPKKTEYCKLNTDVNCLSIVYYPKKRIFKAK